MAVENIEELAKVDERIGSLLGRVDMQSGLEDRRVVAVEIIDILASMEESHLHLISQVVQLLGVDTLFLPNKSRW